MTADVAVRPAPVSWLPPLLLAAAGAVAVLRLTEVPTGDASLREAFTAPVVLSAFDLLAALLVVRPGGRRSLAETATLLAVALPFHVALAAGAGAGAGFHAACALAFAGWAAAGLAAARAGSVLAAGAVSFVAFGLPLAAYGVAEFLGQRSAVPFLASPLTGPAFFAHDAPGAQAADGVPALLTGALLAALLLVRRPPRAAAAAGVLLLFAAGTAHAQDGPSVTIAGGVVRAGRPVVVRVPGAARVRASSGPWALPQGERGDEFVLQVLRADVTLNELEVELPGGRVVHLGITTRTFPAGDRLSLQVGTETIREAWLVADEVTEPSDILSPPAVRAGLDAWREGPKPGDPERAVFDPLLHPSGEAAHDAMREVAARTPRLPSDVSTAALLTAAATAALLLATLRRAMPSWTRAAWTAAPALACGVWLLAADRLPGPVRATALRLEGLKDRLVLLRFEAAAPGEVSFQVPADATSAAILAWDEADATVRDAETGREVRLTLPAGATRVIAWREPPGAAEDPGSAAAAPGPGTAAWLASLGLEATGGAPEGRVRVVSPRGFVPLEGASWRVAKRK